jgi:hypothetical protein
LVTSIDWYAGIRAKCGETASRNLVNAVARAIRRAVGESAASAYLGEGRFATLLSGQSPDAVKCLADSLAKDFRSRESHHESVPRPTLTSAVMPWHAGCKADRSLNGALETLVLAQQSGGDCLVLDGQFNKELTAWREEMSTGNPFTNVVAQDIMEPFPALLEASAEQRGLLEALRRSGVPVWPYVDRDGRMIRVANDENAASSPRNGQNSNPARDTHALPETIPFDASFPEIYEAFASRGCTTLVVTANDHPLGYLTCDGFLSMIDPIHADSFANSNKSADDLTYLIVPSAIGEAASAQAIED